MKSAYLARNFRNGRPLIETAILSHQEVAAIMTARGCPMSRQRVMQLEHAAIRKLREVMRREEYK